MTQLFQNGRAWQKLAATSVPLVALATPAAAWQHGMDNAGDDILHWVGEDNFTNDTQLIFYCFSSSPGDIYAQLHINQPSGGVGLAVEMTISVNGTPFSGLAAEVTEVNGNLALITPRPDPRVAEAARAIYAEDDIVTVTYYENAWHFAGADYSDAFGAMLDGCG